MDIAVLGGGNGSFAAASRRPCARQSSGPACGVARSGRRRLIGRTVAPSRSGISLGAAVWRTGARHIEHRRGGAWRQIDHLPTPLLCPGRRTGASHRTSRMDRSCSPAGHVWIGGVAQAARRSISNHSGAAFRRAGGRDVAMARARKQGPYEVGSPLPGNICQPAFPAARADEALRCVIDRNVPGDDTGLRRRPVRRADE